MLAWHDIVTYSGGSIHDGTLLHSKSQYTTVRHSQKLFEHTYTSNLEGLGTLNHASNQQESVAKYTRTSLLARSQDQTGHVSRIPNTIETCVYCCERNNAACLRCYPPMTLRPSSIVAYLRKRNNVVLSHCCNSANVIEPREPHTCNNIIWSGILWGRSTKIRLSHV
jgi:hypothetical protein